ncbi:MAG TPA: hypothetical protein VF064_19510 [Pyrinomonadaceae bacterium]
MRHRLNKMLLVAALAVLALCGGGALTGSPSSAQSSTPGTWTIYPAQTTTYTTSVRPPIKANGSSVFNGSSVIPVKFKLSSAPGATKFESVFSNNENGPNGEEPIPDDDFSFLSFEPDGELLFNQLTTLKATYSFIEGNCGGGSLRWQVRVDILGNNGDPTPTPCDPDDPTCVPPPTPADDDRSVFIYYGDHPNFTNCTTGANDQSGVNLLTLTDLRFDTSQVGGTFYDTLANANSLVGTKQVASASLVLDSGWRQDSLGNYLDQRVNLGGATVNDNQFTPLSGDPTTTCSLPPATISIQKISDGGTPADPISVQRPNSDTNFTINNDCTYSYNLDTASLLGPGTYQVNAVINGSTVATGATFTVR